MCPRAIGVAVNGGQENLPHPTPKLFLFSLKKLTCPHPSADRLNCVYDENLPTILNAYHNQ